MHTTGQMTRSTYMKGSREATPLNLVSGPRKCTHEESTQRGRNKISNILFSNMLVCHCMPSNIIRLWCHHMMQNTRWNPWRVVDKSHLECRTMPLAQLRQHSDTQHVAAFHSTLRQQTLKMLIGNAAPSEACTTRRAGDHVEISEVSPSMIAA